jgi:queuine tRNA-ribosyltransferase
MLGSVIASTHNLEFYKWLLDRAREEITRGNFNTWKNSVIPRLSNKI